VFLARNDQEALLAFCSHLSPQWLCAIDSSVVLSHCCTTRQRTPDVH